MNKIPSYRDMNWGDFLNHILDPSKANQESCAWIFVEMTTNTWNVLEVKNVGLKGRNIENSFAPDRKEFAKVKRYAKKHKLTKIGNVHTHTAKNLSEAEYQLHPSKIDLKCAQRNNNIIRGIIVTVFPDNKTRGYIYGMIWHDQYGKVLHKERYF